MKIIPILDDITTMEVDAVVNAASKSLLGGGGVDGAIHAAAGPELLEECRGLNGCNPGQVKATGAYKLPAKYILHTVGPVYGHEAGNEARILKDCYFNSLIIADSLDIKTVAFPLISTGAFGYPVEEAVEIIESAIKDFAIRHQDTQIVKMYLVAFSELNLLILNQKFNFNNSD